jgi:hypothetical protein
VAAVSAPKWMARKDLVRRGTMPRHYGTPKGWPRSKVIRRDPATYQGQRDVGIRMCGNWPCKLWIPSNAPRCPHCHERQTAVT